MIPAKCANTNALLELGRSESGGYYDLEEDSRTWGMISPLGIVRCAGAHRLDQSTSSTRLLVSHTGAWRA